MVEGFTLPTPAWSADAFKLDIIIAVPRLLLELSMSLRIRETSTYINQKWYAVRRKAGRMPGDVHFPVT
jgi:hypothetical protein